MTIALDQLCISASATLRATMQLIDGNSAEIALVIDADGVMVGTVSDGDIRRALLRGASLEDAVEPHAERNFTWVGPEANRAEVLDLMQSRYIAQIPVLDADARPTGLHLLREVVGGLERPNVAVVMAGGRGTRLRPMTDTVPKPMVHVAGRPILERIVLHLVGSGIRTVYLAVNYLRETIEGHFGDGSVFGCQVEYLREDPEVPLGTGGALALLPPGAARDAPILVMNGDLITQFHVGDLLDSHRAGANLITLAVREYLHEVPFGVVSLRDGCIDGLVEKPTSAWTVNAGIYVVEPDLLSRIPSGTEYPITELVADCLRHREPVGAHRLIEDWADVGEPAELRRARGERT